MQRKLIYLMEYTMISKLGISATLLVEVGDSLKQILENYRFT